GGAVGAVAGTIEGAAKGVSRIFELVGL
ncbi:unnamed protein product, partial [Rotaria sp. Silwood2]